MIVCPGCDHAFSPSANDPAVSTAALGQGTFHLECARARWAIEAERRIEQAAARRERRVASGQKLAAWRAKLDAENAGHEIGTEA